MKGKHGERVQKREPLRAGGVTGLVVFSPSFSGPGVESSLADYVFVESGPQHPDRLREAGASRQGTLPRPHPFLRAASDLYQCVWALAVGYGDPGNPHLRAGVCGFALSDFSLGGKGIHVVSRGGSRFGGVCVPVPFLQVVLLAVSSPGPVLFPPVFA